MLLIKFNPMASKFRLNLTPSRPGISTQIKTEQNANMTLWASVGTETESLFSRISGW
jgi:hypothetical protein